MIPLERGPYCAAPFPHCVIDDFAEEDELRAVLDEWPAWEAMTFKDRGSSMKAQNGRMGHAARRVIDRLNSAEFISALEDLTGIRGLIADPDLTGAGLHEVPPGGFLNMHVDFNWHQRLEAARKINLLLYLNADWKWNGELLLADDGGRRVRKSIEPIFNRCVIFNTSDESWHGHPEPLNAPRSRKSIALYYYRREARPQQVRSTKYLEAA